MAFEAHRHPQAEGCLPLLHGIARHERPLPHRRKLADELPARGLETARHEVAQAQAQRSLRVVHALDLRLAQIHGRQLAGHGLEQPARAVGGLHGEQRGAHGGGAEAGESHVFADFEVAFIRERKLAAGGDGGGAGGVVGDGFEARARGVEDERLAGGEAARRAGAQVAGLARAVEKNAAFAGGQKHDHVVELIERRQRGPQRVAETHQCEMRGNAGGFEQLREQQRVVFAVAVFVAQGLRGGGGDAGAAAKFDGLVGQLALDETGERGGLLGVFGQARGGGGGGGLHGGIEGQAVFDLREVLAGLAGPVGVGVGEPDHRQKTFGRRLHGLPAIDGRLLDDPGQAGRVALRRGQAGRGFPFHGVARRGHEQRAAQHRQGVGELVGVKAEAVRRAGLAPGDGGLDAETGLEPRHGDAQQLVLRGAFAAFVHHVGILHAARGHDFAGGIFHEHGVDENLLAQRVEAEFEAAEFFHALRIEHADGLALGGLQLHAFFKRDGRDRADVVGAEAFEVSARLFRRRRGEQRGGDGHGFERFFDERVAAFAELAGDHFEQALEVGVGRVFGDGFFERGLGLAVAFEAELDEAFPPPEVGGIKVRGDQLVALGQRLGVASGGKMAVGERERGLGVLGRFFLQSEEDGRGAVKLPGDGEQAGVQAAQGGRFVPDAVAGERRQRGVGLAAGVELRGVAGELRVVAIAVAEQRAVGFQRALGVAAGKLHIGALGGEPVVAG